MEDNNILAYIRAYSALHVTLTFLTTSHMENIGTRPDSCSFYSNGIVGAAPVFAQYLQESKHPKYSIAQINDYPTTPSAVQIVTTLAYAWASDSVLNGDRLAPIVFGGVSVETPFITGGHCSGLTSTLRSSTSSAMHLSRFGPSRKVGDGRAISCQVQAMGYLVSAWRM